MLTGGDRVLYLIVSTVTIVDVPVWIISVLPHLMSNNKKRHRYVDEDITGRR